MGVGRRRQRAGVREWGEGGPTGKCPRPGPNPSPNLILLQMSPELRSPLHQSPNHRSGLSLASAIPPQPPSPTVNASVGSCSAPARAVKVTLDLRDPPSHLPRTGGFPESGTLSARTWTVPDKPGQWVTLPWLPDTSYSLFCFQSFLVIPGAPPSPSTGIRGLGEGPWEGCPLAALPRFSASEWVVRMVTLWALPAPWRAGPCLQDCPRGALVSAPHWPLPDFGPLAGFGAAPPSPLFGP